MEHSVAEALQSENLTLKKAAIVIFKQLMDAQNGNLPIIDGVDWSSDKVASGKSGRALNYIISQQARVDNRISNEEITNYESDSQMLDSTSSRNGPDSPSSRQSSPQSTAGDTGSYWNGGFEITQEQYNHVQHKKRKSLKYDYPGSSDASSIQAISSGAFIDPNVLQSIGSTFNNPPTPPTALDGMDYLPPGQLQWPNQQQQPTRFYEDERYTLQRYSEAAQSVRGPAGEVPCDSGSMPWGAVGPEFYQYMAEKEYGKYVPLDPVYRQYPMRVRGC